MWSGNGGRSTTPATVPAQRAAGKASRWTNWWRVRLKRDVERDLYRRIRRELRGLGIQPPLSVETLCEALGKKRGRPIELRACPLPKPGPSGLWAETRAVDVVLYQRETTRWHQEHIILHEIAHLIVADDDATGRSEENGQEEAADQWAALVPGVAPEAVRRILRRCSYDDERECAVELIATIIQEWSSVLDRTAPALAQDPSARRVQTALGDRQGWL